MTDHINYIDQIIAWLKVNYLFLTFLGLGIWYGKAGFKTFVFDPLAGGNGTVQMDEMAKGITLGILILASWKDGNRTHEWAYFSDAFYAILLSGVFAIAAIQPARDVMTSYFNSKTKDAGGQ